MPSRPHPNSYPPKEKPKKPLTKIDTDVHPTGNVYEQKYSTYKAKAHGGPIIKTPRNRALWRRAVYVPHSPHSPPIPTPSSPDMSTQTYVSPPQIHSPPPPVCLLCMGYLGGEYIYTTCNSYKAKYATPSHRLSGEDEYVDDFFSPSPSPQDEDSDAPTILLDGYIAKGEKSCFIDNANNCATLASQSPSLTCSDDEFDGCVTPASCSSSVYSQDESDMDTRRLEHFHGTNRPDSESLFTGSTDNCVTVTPALSTSSSVYSQDESGIVKVETERVEAERAGTETVGYYELPEIAHYFGEYQQSEGKEFEENVEEDYSLAIEIYYR